MELTEVAPGGVYKHRMCACQSSVFGRQEKENRITINAVCYMPCVIEVQFSIGRE